MASIAVDIDSTLYDFETPARDACLQLWQETGDLKFKEASYHPWTEWRSPADVLADADGSVQRWLDAIALVHDSDAILGMQPFKGAVETCQALVEAGHKLIYISNRATETEFATRQWLANHNFLIDEEGPNDKTIGWKTKVVVTTGDKTPFIKDCQFLIDDRLKTCIQFVYDFDWEQIIRIEADRIRTRGPDEGTPLYEEYMAALGDTLDVYYTEGRLLTQEEFAPLHAIAEKAAKAYISANQRRAFVPAYPYNQNATDIPHLYLAPTWAGLNVYLERKGVLPKAAFAASQGI